MFNEKTHIKLSQEERKKEKLLLVSIFLDLIGMSTYLIPFFGEFFDLIWAPISAVLLWVMYRKTYGSLGGVFGFFEEILPGFDFIPTFTIMWFLKCYVLKNKSQEVITAQ